MKVIINLLLLLLLNCNQNAEVNNAPLIKLFSVFNSGQIAASPTFSLPAGHYNTPQYITLTSATAGADIYYTVDGTDPTTSSYKYTAPIHIWSIAGATIKAVAIKSGLSDSPIATGGIYSYPPLKTGQTSCYDGGNNAVTCSSTYKGQDGQENQGVTRKYTGPTAHATYTSDYTTTDNATGLVWKTCSQGLSGATCATGSAIILPNDGNVGDATNDVSNGCNALNSANSGNGYAGLKTWRLPTRQELETLPNYGSYSPAINTTSFLGTISLQYWSSTTLANMMTNAWVVLFDGGGVGSLTKTSNYYIRCISGQQKIFSLRLVDIGDGTVKDNATGLIWQKCSMGQTNDTDCSGLATTATWINAFTYCNTTLNNLPTASPRTWRLPNVKELKTIVNTTKYNPAIDVAFFPSTASGRYWTSTTFAPNASDAWFINFSDGLLTAYNKNSIYYVRCVSGP